MAARVGVGAASGCLRTRCRSVAFPAFAGSAPSQRGTGQVPSAAAHYRLDIVETDHLEGYVQTTALPTLVSRFALDENTERPNIALRTVADHVWPFGPDDEIAPPAIVAVDLLEANNDRTRRTATQLLQQL